MNSEIDIQVLDILIGKTLLVKIIDPSRELLFITLELEGAVVEVVGQSNNDIGCI